MLTSSHPFTGRDMNELQANLKKGAYKIPKNVELSPDCLDFLNSCLRFDTVQRKDWEELLHHAFLTH